MGSISVVVVVVGLMKQPTKHNNNYGATRESEMGGRDTRSLIHCIKTTRKTMTKQER